MCEVKPLTYEQNSKIAEIMVNAVAEAERFRQERKKIDAAIIELSVEYSIPVDVLTAFIRSKPYVVSSGSKNTSRIKVTGKSHFYIHRVGEHAIKIGKSVNVSNRLVQQQRKSKHKMKNVFDIEFNNSMLPNSFEGEIKLLGTKLGMINGFVAKEDFSDGHTETYPIEMLDHAITHIMTHLSNLSTDEYNIVKNQVKEGC